ncbi:hypothetical protein Tco_0401326 [Tanacetum coccineum]
MNRLSKRKFVKVCHEKVVRIPLEGDEILQVHGKRTQGAVKTLKNTKVDELKLSDISIVRDFIDVFPEDLSMTTAMTKEEHGVHLKLVLELLRKEKLCVKVASEKERMKPRRVQAVAMTIQYEVRGMILVVQSEAFKHENVLTERLHRSHVLWVEIGESSLTGLELVQETTYKVVLVKEKLKAARDRPKELCSIGLVADRLRLPEELSYIKVDKTLRFVKEPVENSDREVKRFLTSLLDDGRGSGSWMFLFVWSGYAAMRTFCGQAKLLAVRYLVKVSWNSKGYVRFDNQSIECDRLIGIGFMLDFVEFISFTFSDKEIILVIEAVSR